MADLTEVGAEGLSACECPVCFSLLIGERSPMSLPCGHTLCRLCLAGLEQRGGNGAPHMFACPMCRKEIHPKSVSPNHTLRNLIEEIFKDKKPDVGQRSSALNTSYNEIKFGQALDRGAFGEVYCGVWRGNEVAIKVFASGQMTKSSLQAFKREVYVMNCLRHPNVVLMLGACQQPPKLAILMEYVAGGSLYQLLHVDKIVLTLEGMSGVGADICRGLQYLHSINIVHRDLKSKNVLLTAAPPLCQAKLCDFGMARMRLESATMTGNVGTIHWTAPEVMANQRYKFPADVYSFGMVLYEMVTGHIPFQELIPVAVMMAVAVNKQQPQIPATAPPPLTTLIKQCVSWEPDLRPPVADVLTALVELMPAASVRPHIAEQQSEFIHSDSLGVIFMSVTDSTHAGVEVESLMPSGSVGLVSDAELAQQLQQESLQSQLYQDAQLAEQLQLKENSYMNPSDLVPKVSAQSLKQEIKKKAVSKYKYIKPTRNLDDLLSHPPPPAPPPPPPIRVPGPPPYVNKQRTQLLKHVKRYAGHIKHKLRPVTPVEKRAFRVGRVVDGHNNEKTIFTVQNQILSFSKKYLNPVMVMEPPPAFPVGRVIDNRRKSNRVERLSSMFNEASIQPHSLPRKLQLDISVFEKDRLQNVVTRDKNLLPTSEDIEEEKAQKSKLY